MDTFRFGRQLSLPSTIAIKHQIRRLMADDRVKKSRGGGKSAVDRHPADEGRSGAADNLAAWELRVIVSLRHWRVWLVAKWRPARVRMKRQMTLLAFAADGTLSEVS